ncbi:MAG: hypothetical protein V4564_09035 [Pseudomonadota bacterium]
MTWLAWPAPLALAGATSTPLDVLDINGPALAHGDDPTSGKGCTPVRAKRLDELPPPWRGWVARISVSCEPMPGIDGDPDTAPSGAAARDHCGNPACRAEKDYRTTSLKTAPVPMRLPTAPSAPL